MKHLLIVLAALGTLVVPAFSQVAARRPFVRASGEGVITVRPDQVKVMVNVSVQAATAQEATENTAGQIANVMSALRGLLGANADIRTVGVSVYPVYRNVGGQSQLVGYQASNSIEVTLNDLTMAGKTVDTAVQAGATSIGGLRFTLKDAAPYRNQALRAATMQAKTSAEAIAGGLGMRVGAIAMAEEGASVRGISTVDARAMTAGATTPVEPGAVEVRAMVTLEAELMQ